MHCARGPARIVARTRLTAVARPSARVSLPLAAIHQQQQRQIFGGLLSKLTGRTPPPPPAPASKQAPTPILSEDDLFHPFSKSPFPQIRARGEAVKSLAPCPVCASEHEHEHAHTQAQPKSVQYECPDCGWPTHCSEEHWHEDTDHGKYCSRLREVNEDEHDLRSGRRLREFEMPGPQDSEAAISFANWDTFWYTREFPSMDTDRSRRHASKLLTYPVTIGSVLHQYSSLTLNNQRLTPEGARSLAALRSTLHTAPGAPETPEAAADKPQMRIFVLGARAESSLPTHVWEQLTMLFPAAQLHVIFVGPQVSLPKAQAPKPSGEGQTTNDGRTNKADKAAEPSTELEQDTRPHPSEEPAAQAATAAAGAQAATQGAEKQVNYLPNVYEPPTPAPIARQKRTRNSIEAFGVPSYTTPYTAALTVSGLRASYMEVHPQFAETYDPYTDAFFLFSPGFGFPSPSTPPGEPPLLQIASPTEWGPVLPNLLASKCAIFVTGFSPADVERDVRALATAPGVAGEFDWLITPGPNAFASEKWEVADFDPRVMVKTNWGVWGIRGKRREVRERGTFGGLF